MDYSVELKNTAREHKVPVQTLVMADLISAGYSEEDAYYIAFGVSNGTLGDKQNESVRQNIVNSNSFASLVMRRKRVVSGNSSSESIFGDTPDNLELFSKEKVAKEMLRSAMKLKDNDPDRVQALMKYADLMGMKKEETRTEEEQTSYYLPLKCGLCPFKDWYNKNFRK